MLRSPMINVKEVVVTAATTSSTTSFQIPQNDFDMVLLKLTCQALTGTTPTLDVYVQTTPDGGTTFRDSVHFTQIVASGATEYWASVPNSDFFSGAVGDATIAANAQGLPLISRLVRVKYVIGGTTPSAEFTLDCFLPQEAGVSIRG